MVPPELGDNIDGLLNRELAFDVDMSMGANVNISVEDVNISEANVNIVHGDSLNDQHLMTIKIESMLNIETWMDRGPSGDSNTTTNEHSMNSITSDEPNVNCKKRKGTSQGTINPISVSSEPTVEEVQVNNLLLCKKDLCKKLSVMTKATRDIP